MKFYILVQEDNTQDAYSYGVIGITENKDIADEWKAILYPRSPVENVVCEVETDVFIFDNRMSNDKRTLEFLKKYARI